MKQRLPNFDDFEAALEMTKKYGEDLRNYFLMAQTQSELEAAKKNLMEDNEKKFPKDAINYFYQERKQMLGPEIKSKLKDEFDDSERSLLQKIDTAQREILNKTV